MPILVEVTKRDIVNAMAELSADEILGIINDVTDTYACVELDEMIMVKMWKNVLTAYDADDTPSFGDLVRQYKDKV